MAISFFGKKPGADQRARAGTAGGKPAPRSELSTLDFSGAGDIGRALAQCADKVEVLEVFSYACIHCAHFQPYADEIKAKLPAFAEFSYMPAIFNDQWEAFARAYYTAQSLGLLDKTHQAMFDAVHRDHRPFRSFDDIAAFYGEHGADVEKFKQIATSFEVESKLARSRSMVPKYGVDGTPTIIVDGKYRVTGASAGGYPQMVALVELLARKAHEAKGK